MDSRANSTCLRDNVSDYCSINGNSYLKSEIANLDTMLTDESYNCIFFPISKVYIGAKMPDGKRREIIKICNSRSIPSTCVLPAFSSFSMQECTGKMLNPNCIYKKLS